MVLMNVVQDDTMTVPGFEHHTFTCLECQDVEQRLVFTKQDRESDTEPMPEQAAPPVVPASTVQDEPVAASGLLSCPVEPAQTALASTLERSGRCRLDLYRFCCVGMLHHA